ncbi:MAG: helix-turn-helix transcriptional regulator [Planctomycetota bacterium]
MHEPPGTTAYLASLGQALRRRREKMGLSQEQFAFEVEMDRTYVSGIERGRRNPTVATLRRLTQVLGISPSTLLKDAEKASK